MTRIFGLWKKSGIQLRTAIVPAFHFWSLFWCICNSFDAIQLFITLDLDSLLCSRTFLKRSVCLTSDLNPWFFTVPLAPCLQKLWKGIYFELEQTSQNAFWRGHSNFSESSKKMKIRREENFLWPETFQNFHKISQIPRIHITRVTRIYTNIKDSISNIKIDCYI